MIRIKKSLNQHQDIYQFRGCISNIYIIVDKLDKATYLVDCGLPSDSNLLISVLSSLPPLKSIICTHFHVDHSSGWILLKNHFKNCNILFHNNAIPFIFGDKRIPFPSLKDCKEILIPCMIEYQFLPSIKDFFMGGLYGTPFKKGFPLDRISFFLEGDPILPGFTTFHTPGHRPESSSFLHFESGVLISGDFILVLKKKLKINTFLSNAKDQNESLEKIKYYSKNISFLYPGHGDIINFLPIDI